MIVMKFGGSSLATAADMRQVADLVAAAATTPCVVLSAMGDTTDRLLELARPGEGAGAGLSGLFARAHATAGELLREPALVDAPLRRLQGDAELLLRAIEKKGADARTTDALVAHGERVSTLLLTALLHERGVSALAVDARDVISTDETFGRARPNRGRIRQLAQQNIGPHVGRGVTVVTQGYIGRSASGATTTLGRGGSDWSAALLGVALGADELQIWTDVEGVLTCDPRTVPDARTIPSLSPDEAAELAAFGTRFLHPSAMQPVVDRGIPVTVRHTMRPEASFTRISSSCGVRRPGIAALASRGPVTVLTMTSRRMLAASGYLARLFEVFDELDASVDLVTTAEVSVSCTVADDAPVDRLIAALDGLAHVVVTPGCAILAAIGDGLQHTPRVLERACRALHPIEPHMVCFDSSGRNLSFVVPGAQRAPALLRLHAELFTEDHAGDIVAPS